MKYQCLNPSNSRVFVDYNKPKNQRVSFSYPNKLNAFKICFNCFLILGLKILFIPFVLSIITFIVAYSILPTYFIYNSIILLGVYIFVPLILSLVFISNKKLLLKMPIINYVMVSQGFFIFNSQEFFIARSKGNLKSTKFEIPLFDNIYLDFQTTFDYAKYLKTIEVVEIPFLYQRKGKEIKKSDTEWKAIFTFKKIPKKGEIEVLFL